jgi:diacylglycerol kinase family enzyme
VEAAGELLDALDRKSFRRIGLGRIGDRHFLFHCGVGFDAAVVEAVERRAAFKRYAAHPLFVMAAFDTWLRTYDHSHGRFAVTFPDGETVPDATFLIISKVSPYTYLGHRPITVAPAASLDSALSFTVVRSRHTPSILSVAARAFLSTKALHRQRDVVQRDGITAATITSEEPFPYQVDGDFLGDVRRLDVAYVPDAITLVAP